VSELSQVKMGERIEEDTTVASRIEEAA